MTAASSAYPWLQLPQSHLRGLPSKMNRIQDSEIFSTDGASTSFMCTFYCALGVFSLLCNCLNMTVWLSSRDLRKKYICAIVLDACEAVNGVSYILVGIGRGLALVQGHLTNPITVRQCFLEKFWPHSLILGTQLPALCIILISYERLLAVLRPSRYARIFSGNLKIMLLLLVPLLATASLLVGGLSTMGTAGDVTVTSQHCPIISSTAPWYASFHYLFSVSAYIASFVSVFVVWRTSKRYSAGKNKNRDNRLSAMLISTGSSIILVGSKSAVMLSSLWDIYRFDNFTVTITYSMPGFMSIAGTVVNLVFRPEYRRQFFAIVHVRDPCMPASFSKVQTMSVKTRMSVAAHTKF